MQRAAGRLPRLLRARRQLLPCRLDRLARRVRRRLPRVPEQPLLHRSGGALPAAAVPVAGAIAAVAVAATALAAGESAAVAPAVAAATVAAASGTFAAAGTAHRSHRLLGAVRCLLPTRLVQLRPLAMLCERDLEPSGVLPIPAAIAAAAGAAAACPASSSAAALAAAAVGSEQPEQRVLVAVRHG